MKFSQRIADLLVETHHNQAELARFIGVKPNTVSDWINKETSPKVEHIYRIADFFSVSFNYLFTGENKNKNSLSTISNSIVDHSSGTITISGTAGTKLEPDVKHEINTEQVMSDTSKELLKVFESLPIRERVKLLNMVYEFEEDYRNKEK